MPALRSVEFETELNLDWQVHLEADEFDLTETFAFHRVPRLQEFRFTTNFLPGDLRFPTHITSLHLNILESPTARPLSASVLIELLAPLTSLESLTLCLPLHYEGPFVEEEILEPAVLHSLKGLSMYGPTDMNGLLFHFEAPLLRRLQLRSLEDVGYRQEPIGPALLHFLRSSRAPLELLELHDIDLSSDYFAECFAALPDLRTLRLHESSISDSTVSLLGTLCPKLSRLDLRWCGHLGGEALVRLVTDRNSPGEDTRRNEILGGRSVERIEEVGILNCAHVGESDVLQLAKLTTCRVRLREHDYCRKSVHICVYIDLQCFNRYSPLLRQRTL